MKALRQAAYLSVLEARKNAVYVAGQIEKMQEMTK